MALKSLGGDNLLGETSDGFEKERFFRKSVGLTRVMIDYRMRGECLEEHTMPEIERSADAFQGDGGRSGCGWLVKRHVGIFLGSAVIGSVVWCGARELGAGEWVAREAVRLGWGLSQEWVEAARNSAPVVAGILPGGFIFFLLEAIRFDRESLKDNVGRPQYMNPRYVPSERRNK